MDYSELFNLKGKVAIVTGGASGIGKASAILLAEAGADIAIGDFKPEEAEKVAAEIRKIGSKAIVVPCNVLNDDDLINLVDTTLDKLGAIHILVNNAGGSGGGKENPFKISVD